MKKLVGTREDGSQLYSLGEDETGELIGQIVSGEGKEYAPLPMVGILSKSIWAAVEENAPRLEQWF